MWSIAVPVFQVLKEGVLVVLPEAGAPQQAEVQDEAEAAEHASVAQQGQRASVHLHDTWTVRQTEGTGP